MKKFLKILLIIVAVLAAALLAIRLLLPEPEYFLTEEECAQRVVGTWEDPLGDYAPHVFNEDGTGLLGDIPVTWEIADRHNAGGGVDHDFFYVHCTGGDGEKVYSITFEYYADIDYLRARPYYIYNKKLTESYGAEHELYEGLERDSLSLCRYKTGSWEIVNLDQTNWEEYFFIGHRDASFEAMGEWNWRYLNFVTLKPEYTARAMSLGNGDYTLGCTYSYLAMPYATRVDAEAKTVVLGERDDSAKEVSDLYVFPNEHNYAACLPGEIYIDDMDFGAELDYIFVYGDYGSGKGENEYEYIIERSRLLDAEGTLLLAKTLAE